MSKLLGHAFGMSEDFFPNLQTRYDLDLASIDAENSEKAAERLRRADDLARELCFARRPFREPNEGGDLNHDSLF